MNRAIKYRVLFKKGKVIKKIPFIILSVLILSFLLGCDEVQIWETKKDPYKMEEVADKDMKSDVFYVKRGTKFMPTFSKTLPENNNKGIVTPSKVVYVVANNRNLVPNLYKDEVLAYSSSKEMLSNIYLERFKDMGLDCFEPLGAFYVFPSVKEC